MFGPEIWVVEGRETEVAGFRYPTRMVVVRLTEGDLFVWSPVALSTSLKAEIAALGEVHHLVAPNSLHHLFLDEWRQAYPQARLHAAPGLRRRRPDLDAELGDTPPAEWAQDLDQVVVRGNALTTEVVFFHHQSNSVLFTDLIQQFRPGWFTGWRALVARLDLMVAPEPSVPRKFRIAFFDRPAARHALRRILYWPSSKILMAHGAPAGPSSRVPLAGSEPDATIARFRLIASQCGRVADPRHLAGSRTSAEELSGRERRMSASDPSSAYPFPGTEVRKADILRTKTARRQPPPFRPFPNRPDFIGSCHRFTDRNDGNWAESGLRDSKRNNG